jgi:hypothetical protein
MQLKPFHASGFGSFFLRVMEADVHLAGMPGGGNPSTRLLI